MSLLFYRLVPYFFPIKSEITVLVHQSLFTTDDFLFPNTFLTSHTMLRFEAVNGSFNYICQKHMKRLHSVYFYFFVNCLLRDYFSPQIVTVS